MFMIYVDVVEPHRARITCPDARAYAGTDEYGLLYVEVDDADDVSLIGETRNGFQSFEGAADWVAEVLGVGLYKTVVTYEYT